MKEKLIFLEFIAAGFIVLGLGLLLLRRFKPEDEGSFPCLERNVRGILSLRGLLFLSGYLLALYGGASVLICTLLIFL
ncbi:MAG: hypothetical protein RDV48_12620 [Candidatus Eremiobacteraeota bacterium]|nr:hypothetical protein [Candidatus Eremiobacteraeota bacterium]